MSFPVAIAISFILAFLLGSIPCGVIIGKLVYGIDPRSGGSGSIGATNANRMLGIKGGLAVMVCDMLKGAVAVGIARVIIACVGFEGNEADVLLIGTAFFGIAGHIYSPWLGFKGGKGISTGFGVLLVASWPIAVGIVVVFLAFAATTRYVSLGSMCAAFSVFVWCLVFHWGSVPFAVFGALIAIMVIYAHRANIGRLRRGEESKFHVNKSAEKKKAEND